MLDVAVIGGGVCGLSLAHNLHPHHVHWALFEARERLGGRIMTLNSGHRVPLDLGATWMWPAYQTALTKLVTDLGLANFPQVDDGRILHLAEPGQPPVTLPVQADANGQPSAVPGGQAQPGMVHGGGHRVAGGMGTVVQALAKTLPSYRVQRGVQVEALSDQGEFIRLSLRQGSRRFTQEARQVVLALPPRLAEARIRFEPALPPELADTLRSVPTWMATSAKAAFSFETPFWRRAGHTGNAWVTHANALLAEVFDAGQPHAGGGALSGFLALSAQSRPHFEKDLVGMLRHQLSQLFGAAALQAEVHTHDWAQDPWTCAPLDLAEDGRHTSQTGHPASYGAPLLQHAHWQGRLHFGGSETASMGAGYLEGALGAASRIRRQVLSGLGLAPKPTAWASSANDGSGAGKLSGWPSGSGSSGGQNEP